MSDEVIPPELLSLRDSIDNFDAALIHILAERFRCVREVSHLKATRSMPPSDLEREKRQTIRLRRLAQESGLNPDFAERMLNFIIAEAVRDHEVIAAKVSAHEKPLEKFPKTASHFSDKNCGENKELERSTDLSEVKTALSFECGGDERQEKSESARVT